ncbi:MAG TPA: hypothetical protein V6C81_18500 [Planktothrix sp.]
MTTLSEKAAEGIAAKVHETLGLRLVQDVDEFLHELDQLRTSLENDSSRSMICHAAGNSARYAHDLERNGIGYFHKKKHKLEKLNSIVEKVTKLSQDLHDSTITSSDALKIEAEVRSDLITMFFQQ